MPSYQTIKNPSNLERDSTGAQCIPRIAAITGLLNKCDKSGDWSVKEPRVIAAISGVHLGWGGLFLGLANVVQYRIVSSNSKRFMGMVLGFGKARELTEHEKSVQQVSVGDLGATLLVS